MKLSWSCQNKILSEQDPDILEDEIQCAIQNPAENKSLEVDEMSFELIKEAA